MTNGQPPLTGMASICAVASGALVVVDMWLSRGGMAGALAALFAAISAHEFGREQGRKEKCD